MRAKNWRAALILNVACLPFYAYIYAVHFNVGTKAEQECGTSEDTGYNVGPGTTTRPNHDQTAKDKHHEPHEPDTTSHSDGP